jgi:hypothetical protein
MYWLVAGLFILGAICGASIRLMVFVVVLIGAAVIAAGASLGQGGGAALLHAVIAVVALQVGYVAGLVLRTAARSLRQRPAADSHRQRTVSAPFGEKRR